MLGAKAAAGTGGHADRQGQRDLAIAHIATLRDLIGDLIEAHCREVGKHDLGHRPEALHGRPQRAAHDGLFRNGRIEDALGGRIL